MLIKLFILNTELRAVAVRVTGSGEFEYLQGHELYMEPIDKSVKRIAKEIADLDLEEGNFMLVRRESATVISNDGCRVESIVTYAYKCGSECVDLSHSGYNWITVDKVIRSLCDTGKYFEAAYLNEACEVV